MSSSITFPIVITSSGLQPQAPATLRATLLTTVAAINPGYTATLPGSLIEDVSSTAVYGIALCDSAKVDLVNSLTPFGANAYILGQLGDMFGIPQGSENNASVYVVFTGNTGFRIPAGFIVTDGTYQYVTQESGVCGDSGTGFGPSQPVFCVASVYGIWPIPAGTVTGLISSVPTGYTLTVTNPNAGTQATAEEAEEDYRAIVLQSWAATVQGFSSTLKANLAKVPGVQQRFISVKISGTLYEIICNGGDPYQTANAIYDAIFDIATLIGSTITLTSVTLANPGVFTTNLTTGFTEGQTIVIAGSNPSNYNGTYTVHVLSPNSFSLSVSGTPLNTSSFPAYVGSAVVTPNARNVDVSIIDPPNTYVIPIVIPFQDVVEMSLLWGTDSPNFVSESAVNQLGVTGLLNYVNSLATGQPLNLFDMQDAFRNAVSSVIPTSLISRMVFTVNINGLVVTPSTGTGLYFGDTESYFFAGPSAITVTKG